MRIIQHRYAPVVLFVAFVTTGMAFGAIINISVFLNPLALEFGWPRGELSLAYTTATISAGVGGIVTGYFSDRLPAKPLVLLGGLMLAMAFFLLSTINSRVELYAYHAVIGFLGFAAIVIPLTNLLTFWFSDNRGLALGIAGAGGALGQGLMPLFARHLISNDGWRDAYLTMGIIYLVVLVPLALLVRQPPGTKGALAEANSTATGKENPYAISRERLLGLTALAVVFCCITMATPIVHTVSLGTDLGMAPGLATGLLTTMMIMGMFGRVLTGRLADKIGNLKVYILLSLGQTSLALWFPYVTGTVAMYALSGVFGLMYAGVMVVFILLAREYSSIRHTGITIGFISFIGWTGMGIGSWQGGWFFDLTGNYYQAYLNATLTGCINLVVLAVIYRYTFFKPARIAVQTG